MVDFDHASLLFVDNFALLSLKQREEKESQLTAGAFSEKADLFDNELKSVGENQKFSQKFFYYIKKTRVVLL